MNNYTYATTGVCSKEITFSIEKMRLRSVTFKAGCQGNLIAMGKLLEGMPIDEALLRLKGINCGSKGTSCADQLCKAIEQALAEPD